MSERDLPNPMLTVTMPERSGKTRYYKTILPSRIPPPGVPVIVASYWCCPEVSYCGAGAKGVRCDQPDCVDRYAYHDRGDEHEQR